MQKAQDTQSTNTSSSVANNSSSSSTSSAATTTDTDSNSVVASFARAVGYYGKSGYTFNITGQSGSTYTIEVRQNNQAGDVANLIGIYQYNLSTGAVNKTF
ncbi:hypothetical protein [Paucilactobacillus hokkaidonensis]|uniref:hypothetical protein n=1 Tax=Paucilactobacillus hokkaidonensis TaxID=1193095 RepID=UPI0006D133F1|nr:hypothetical protein [Paucilactobacillus hokkaidonensis]